jgi:very-short-patch-repair endonuclease
MDGRTKYKWSFEIIHKEALKYQTRIQFQKGSTRAYRAAMRRGLLENVCSHMSTDYWWTKEELHKEALKYKTRTEFQIKNGAAYQSARKGGLLNSICEHMEDVLTYWTLKMIQLEANKYSSREEFQKKARKAYSAAWRADLLDRVCSHMAPSHGSSLAERELFSLIKALYPNAKKLRDMKVKIKGKSHIHGFDIDILVGKLGIEFDGRYHHSYEFMRADPKKAKWSDEDIRNYHQIKDAWFASKGIQILHIKEKDWDKDKQACIDKCLKFLLQSPISTK